MTITRQDIEKIAKLSRLRLSEEEVDKLSKDLPNIMEFVAQLNEVDTDEIEPMSSVLEDMELPRRKDEVTDGGIKDKVLSNAPALDYDCFEVPQVIE